MSTRWAILVSIVIAVGVATALFSRHYLRETVAVRIGGEELRALVADDDAERVQGLSGLPSLDDDTVMLFVFPSGGQHGIWMKEMRFAIDILWLDEGGRVIHIQKNATPESFPHVFTPDGDAWYVIEMNTGTVDQLGIQEGHQIHF